MIIHKLKKRLNSKFSRNIGWLGIAELINRVFRLGTTVTLARLFSPHDYGLMAIIYTVHGIAEVFTLKTGFNAKIIHTEKSELKTICQTSYCLNWVFCFGLVVAQCALSYPIAMFYGEQELVFPLCATALMYLMSPIYMVQSALIQRENRLKVLAVCNAFQTIFANLITITLAWLGFGIWSIIWAMLVSPMIWIVIIYRNNSWRPARKLTFQGWRNVTSFGSSMLGIELLDKMRLNLDYLIVGRFISVDALGMYFFAFSAGLGISQSILNAVIAALFPYLCEVRDNLGQMKERYFSSLKTTAMIIIPFVILQSSLARFYVPIVFGDKWNSAIPILTIICLSAIPLAFTLATYQLLNAVGKIKLTLQWNVIYTIVFSLALLVAVRGGIMWVATTVLICQTLTLLFSYWATKNVFKTTN